MSLDVYLNTKETHRATGSGIFVRDNGRTVEISAEEWNRRHPDREPVRYLTSERETTEVFSANITHNLGRMARDAGVYECLWRPDEIGITTASQLIEPLAAGLSLLKSDPERFKRHNPGNGWGSYEGLVGFVEQYLEACRRWPDAAVSASR
jgi:hypothetical protein